MGDFEEVIEYAHARIQKTHSHVWHVQELSLYKGGYGSSRCGRQSIPSLKEVVNSKPKKKGTSITLSEFNRGGFNQGLTREEMLAFPTNPKKHSVKEMQFNTLATVSPPMITLTDAHVIATAATTKVRGGGA
ncbi:hypothetical protein JHK84_048314 [Glycine max]|nr:hypothetical protein JHK85_048914 [Glycine max]KAG5103345.1 hypothetical protein JHK84_048314 [Glycine max]